MAKSISPKTSRRLPRVPSSGQFTAASPLNDPALLHHVMGNIQAVDVLMPTLLALIHGEAEDSARARLMTNALYALVLVRESFAHHLFADSKDDGSSDLDVDVQRIVSVAQTEWRKLFDSASRPVGRQLVGVSGEGV